jgi:hypothetical protein
MFMRAAVGLSRISYVGSMDGLNSLKGMVFSDRRVNRVAVVRRLAYSCEERVFVESYRRQTS